jgi:hypothetical protein
MLSKPFTEELQRKAKRLRVKPKFLLFAIAELYANPGATESDIKQPYFDSLVADLKEADSRPPKRPKPGETYSSCFEPIRGSYLDQYFTDEDLNSIRKFLLPNEPVVHAHSIAYNQLRGDLNRLHRKWKEAGIKPVPPNEADAVQVIRALCPELIEQYKEIAQLFIRVDLERN